ncbi:MAG: protein-L-isoaspartate(D-aspartate) O-methyltransferase [Gammaproteobacteria bacterium]
MRTHHTEDRRRLLEEIDAEMRATAAYTGRRALAPDVRKALSDVPRECFVSDGQDAYAYDNYPLSIGHGQTISQPYIVALMTELLDTRPEHRVLEVGTGSGYQAAVLARLVREVYSVEIIPALADSARQRLAEEGFDNVMVRNADGYYGWAEHAPYDGILVTATAREIPPPLLEQLKPGGRLVLPLRSAGYNEDLVLVEKAADGSVDQTRLLAVAFVPLTGGPKDSERS